MAWTFHWQVLWDSPVYTEFWAYLESFSSVSAYLIFLPLLALVSTFFLILLRSFWMASHCLWDQRLSYYGQIHATHETFTCTHTHFPMATWSLGSVALVLRSISSRSSCEKERELPDITSVSLQSLYSYSSMYSLLTNKLHNNNSSCLISYQVIKVIVIKNLLVHIFEVHISFQCQFSCLKQSELSQSSSMRLLVLLLKVVLHYCVTPNTITLTEI